MAAQPPAHLAQAHFVYIRKGRHVPPTAPLYVGPYKVLQRHTKTFTLRVGSGEETVSVDRFKEHTGPGPVLPASPPSRGRPPACTQVQPAPV